MEPLALAMLVVAVGTIGGGLITCITISLRKDRENNR